MLFLTTLIRFFTNLDILSDLMSISTLFIFMLVVVVLIVRRYHVSGETSDANHNKLIIVVLLIIGSSIAIATYWGISHTGWIGYCITIPIWILSTAGLWLLVPQACMPKMWGVPLVSWLLSGSIVINIFLLGSMDKYSFMRFGVWTVLRLYYFVFGLHASYDTAKEFELKATKARYGKVAEGQQLGGEIAAASTVQ